MPRFALDIESVPRPARSQELLDAVNHRVVIADGAMGTMLQGRDLQLETDFQNLEGCNEILNDTRPDVIADIHDAYFATGIDAVETNTFGANWSNLSDYGIDDRIEELAQKGARIARERAEAAEATDGRMRWVLGSMGPGTKLPSLGHTSYDWLKQTFALQAEGLIDGGRHRCVEPVAALRAHAGRRLDGHAGSRGVGKGPVEAGHRDRIAVHDAGREQGRREGAHDPGREHDRPVGAGSAEADSDESRERRDQASAAPGGSRVEVRGVYRGSRRPGPRRLPGSIQPAYESCILAA